MFVNLHSHTYYSILDALPSPKDLLDRAKELNQPAIGITDHGTVAAAWEAYKAWKATGVKPIIGCEFYFVDDRTNITEKFRHVILLAKNAAGYSNLLTLNRKGFDNIDLSTKKNYSVIDWNMLEAYSDGLICLTSCGNGIISSLLMKRDMIRVNETVNKLKNIFGDNLGLEVQANNMKRNQSALHEEIDQIFINKQLIGIGNKYDIKIVPTCNVHYINKDEHQTHDVLVAIGSHQPIYSNFRLKYSTPDFYLKSYDEMKSFFSRNYGEEFAEKIISNTVYFANLCEEPEWINPKYTNPSGKELPVFPVKDEPDYNDFIKWTKLLSDDLQKLDEDKLYLRYKCELAFDKKVPKGKEIEYRSRLNEELYVLEQLGLSSYMLIVADYLNWCVKNNIPIGPGRGSAGGAMVGYLIGIHKADPIKYGLVFERFHNLKKSAIADVDCDFAKYGKPLVEEYITNKYGKDNVAHISNFNTITPKVFVRDIARACELGGSREAAVKLGNDIADVIPKDVKTISSALNNSPLFSEYSRKYPEFIKHQNIDGLIRACSTHAAGIVIGKRPLTGLVPVRKDKDGTISLELAKEEAEECGLVKMDILGLSTLDIMKKAEELIVDSGGTVPDWDKITEEYDEKTYDLISRGDTFCVFQFGTSAGTIDLCKKIKPKSIEDLAIITTLARPASKEIREDFIKTREGKLEVSLIHKSLKNGLGSTFGFPLYDESLLLLAKDVAGWDLGEADKLRKLTKEKGKNPEKAKKWEQEFIDGAVKNGISKDTADLIWKKIIIPYSLYSFNKSHAVLYSMISYRTAYLKAHYPIEFLLANLMFEVKSNNPDAEANVQRIKNELRSYKIKILPPDINKSQLTFTIEDGKLLTGLDALKFVGDDAIQDILEKRPFKDFFDFIHRTNTKAMRANTIQALAASGALDSFGLSRKSMFLYASDYKKKALTWLKKHDPAKEKFNFPWEKSEWSEHELFALETNYLGEAFICKPYKAYGRFFLTNDTTIKQTKSLSNKDRIDSIKFIVRDFFEFKIKKEDSKLYGRSMLKITGEDRDGNHGSFTIFPDTLDQLNSILKRKKIKLDNGIAIHGSGSANLYDEEMGVVINTIYDVVGPPALPSDLKHKKVSLKHDENKNETLSFDDIEDEMIMEGSLSSED